jgi:hypothetical protein
VKRNDATGSSKINNYLFSLVFIALLFSSTAKAEYQNDDAHRDAKLAIEKFEADFSRFGITGIVIKTIPDCYSTAGTNYRKIRVCCMLDIWAFTVDSTMKKQMSWPPTEGLTYEDLLIRVKKAVKPLSAKEISEKYGDKDWLDILNETYRVMNK